VMRAVLPSSRMGTWSPVRAVGATAFRMKLRLRPEPSRSHRVLSTLLKQGMGCKWFAAWRKKAVEKAAKPHKEDWRRRRKSRYNGITSNGRGAVRNRQISGEVAGSPRPRFKNEGVTGEGLRARELGRHCRMIAVPCVRIGQGRCSVDVAGG
jgi:hypothetical protein